MPPTLALPYAPLTSTDPAARPDEETLIRRMHWGAMQPVMAWTPRLNTDPWRSEYSPAVMAAFRHYAWLHWELVPYLYSYVYELYEQGWRRTFYRPSDAARFTAKLGEDIFVAYVTDRVTSVDVTFPGCKWFDYWDEAQGYETSQTVTFPVPLGREPIFLRRGSIIPMRVIGPQTGHGTVESKDSLTVLVYPSATTAMRYRQASTGTWIRITSALFEPALTLDVSEPPDRPVIFRIGRWYQVPTSVGLLPLGITVNQGGTVPAAASEAEVNGSDTPKYFYDAAAGRIVVKFVAGAFSDAGADDGDAETEGGDEGEADVLEADVATDAQAQPIDGIAADVPFADASVTDAPLEPHISSTTQQSRAGGGCGCTTGRAGGVPASVLLLLALALRRSRAATARRS
jgi:hypothetical protein